MQNKRSFGVHKKANTRPWKKGNTPHFLPSSSSHLGMKEELTVSLRSMAAAGPKEEMQQHIQKRKACNCVKRGRKWKGRRVDYLGMEKVFTVQLDEEVSRIQACATMSRRRSVLKKN
ncbi:hypothetical protein VIGAN_UM001500 [Vigna angularis var. angularis]|uniref:Uncharacterized protein n=1 Tax=Vigna angularis var. angularis TaxID=157739 RepID=A0A0S3TD16_PHAAN|nr:hypothetical protein VIGAN_UM001500 [Vigna angularis var. angularis]